MHKNELKCALVRRMWLDRLVYGEQYADIGRVVRRSAVPREDEARARSLLEAEMVPNEECPILKVGPGRVTLKRNRDAVRAYLWDICALESDIPWDLRQ